MPSFSKESPIGLFDSGVGGLTVFREMRKLLPNEELIYLGDIARTPYGTKAPQTILGYARECAKFLEERKVKILVVACNTASSVALDALEKECSCPVVGTISPAAEVAVKTSPSGRIGLIGTTRTIASNAYVNKLMELRPEAQVFSRACPLFVPLVEEGILSGEIVDLIVERYLSSLRRCSIDTIILGCTHYPLLKEAIVKYLGLELNVVDCGVAAAQVVKNSLKAEDLLITTARTPEHSYYVTDTGEMFERLATTFLEAENIKAIRVHRL